MSNYTRIFSRVALSVALLAPSTAFAKVPFRANAERASAVTSYTTGTPARTTLGRFGRVEKVVETESLAACTHTHRYSWQHRM